MKYILSLLLIGSSIHIFSQLSFYGGYKVGKYNFREAPVENLCTKFNLGWDFIKTEDNCVISFDPSADNYQIDNFMNRINLPHGLEFGLKLSMTDYLGMQVGLNFLNQKTYGKRVNTTSNLTEELTLKTHYGGLTLNFVFQKFDKIQPFFGFDLGTTYMNYNYSNGTDNIKNQKVGYNVKFGGKVVPGDKEITTSTNWGAIIKVIQKNKITLNLTPSYQWRFPRNIEINQGLYYPYIFNHSNLSLSIWLSYEI